ncbi:MAG: DUF4124 domain-containing protein [Telluria sp.]|nr:DUF4124 domain-containing protein [Telluria sp.]
MNNFNRALPLRLLAAGALMAYAGLAYSQYLWIDEKGIKQFSDRAPPSSVPLKNILKTPGGTNLPVLVPIAPDAPSSPAAVPATPATAPKGPPTLAERNADFRKRAMEQAEREQKAQDEAANKAATAANCESARAMKQTLDSGVRIGITEKNGERGFMSDAQRGQEAGKVNKVLAGCR